MQRISDPFGTDWPVRPIAVFCEDCGEPIGADDCVVRTMRGNRKVTQCESCWSIDTPEYAGVRGGMRVAASAPIFTICGLAGLAVLVWVWVQ